MVFWSPERPSQDHQRRIGPFSSCSWRSSTSSVMVGSVVSSLALDDTQDLARHIGPSILHHSPPETAPELFVSMARGQEIAKAEAHLLAYGGEGHGWGLVREILLSGVVICKPLFHVRSMSSISRRGLPSRDQLCGRVGAGDKIFDGAEGASAQRAPVPAAAGACLFQAPPERSTDVHVADTVCRRSTPVRCVE